MRTTYQKFQKVSAFLTMIILLCATLSAPAFAADVDTISVSGDGGTIEIDFSGYSPNWWVQQELTFQYADGTMETYYVCAGSGILYVKTQSWQDWPTTGTSDFSAGNGTYAVSLQIPVSSLKSADVTSMTFFGTSFSAEQLGLSNKENIDGNGNSGEGGGDGESDSGDNAGNSGGTGSDTLSPTISGKITVDGSLEDWETVTQLASTDNKVDYWKVAQDTEGNLYLCFTGTAVSQWDGDYQWKTLTITQNGNCAWLQIASLQYIGATVVTDNQANGNAAAPYYVELVIPSDYFTDPNFIISFAGVDMTASAIEILDGTNAPEKEDAAYTGIVIDGKFSDWDAVGKEPASCPNGNLDQSAMVFDGDYVYIYLRETPGGSAEGAGSHSNGQYSITTDLGRELVFQLRDGAVNGVEGATAQHVGAQWEIAIPASALPQYQQSLSFGLYQQEPFITGVTNLDGSSGNAGTFEGIVIDGQYEDWDYYPHQRIDYATAGTHEEVVDSEGAIFAQDGTLYGHVVTTMPAHLNAQGTDFLSAISVAFNGDKEYKSLASLGNFYPRLIPVDENGNVIPENEGAALDNGTYTYYIWDARLPYDANTASDAYFGVMKVTVNGTCDEMEFELDLEKVAALSGADASDFQQIDVQFGRFGQQWLSTAGTSSGPWLGVLLCLTVVGIVWGRRKRENQVTLA